MTTEPGTTHLDLQLRPVTWAGLEALASSCGVDATDVLTGAPVRVAPGTGLRVLEVLCLHPHGCAEESADAVAELAATAYLQQVVMHAAAAQQAAQLAATRAGVAPLLDVLAGEGVGPGLGRTLGSLDLGDALALRSAPLSEMLATLSLRAVDAVARDPKRFLA